MKLRAGALALALLVPSALHGQASRTIAKAPASLPTATPTPAPLAGRTVKPLAVGTALAAPVHAPQQLEFGDVWDGQSSRRTLELTTTAAGNVNVQFSGGPFRVVEFRLMHPRGPAESAQLRLGAGSPRQVELRLSYPAGQPSPNQWTVGSGQDVEIEVLFEPRFDLLSMTAGPKSAVMRVAGPGPQLPWNLSIPLHGMFKGLHIGAVFTVDDKEVLAVAGTAHVDVGVRLVGVDQTLTGTVHGQNVPPGLAVGSVPVKVEPAQTVTAKVPLSFSWASLPADGRSRDVQLLLDVPGRPSTATFSVVPVPGTVNAGAQRTDCGIQWLGWSAIFFPQGRLTLSMSGNNQDALHPRDVLGVVTVAGRPVAWGLIHLDLSAKPTQAYANWDSARVNANFDARFGAGDYLAAVRGPVAFSCRLVGTQFNPPF